MANLKFKSVKRATPCMHKCQKPTPATVFVKWHPFKPDWEVRKCFNCGRLSAYSITEDNNEN